MTDDANGFQLNRQRHDFQDVHYVVHGRENSVIIWLRDPAAAAVTCDAVAVAAEMILSSLASFFLVPRVHASPVFFNLFFGVQEKRKKGKFKVIRCFFYKNDRKQITRQQSETNKAINTSNDRKQMSVG